MTREEIEQSTWEFLRSKGLSENCVAGIMGNIEAESEFSPSLVESGNGIGFGLCQWSYERRTQLENYGTDLQSQFNFLWAELSGEIGDTGANFQWINKSGYVTHAEFMGGNISISDATLGFCFSWERPNVDLAHIERRQTSAYMYYERYTGTVIDNSSEKVENAVQWMISIANDDAHGYDQNSRWGPDYDCGTLVISGYEQAGVLLKTNGATYTGNLKQVAIDTGFSVVNWDNDVNNLKRGDIILNEVHHVCCYIGEGKIVQASINELGTARGGQTGDQTTKEIYMRDYYVYTSGWDCVLRYGNGSNEPTDPIDPTDPNDPIDPHKGEVYGKLITTTYIIEQLTEEQKTFLKTLRWNDKVKLKHTFNKRKSNGVNYTGKRLTIDELSYIIVDVENNGFIKLTTSLDNKCYKFVNPLLVKEV